MDLSSSRILTASSIANTSSGAIIIPAVKNSSSSLHKNSLNPVRIGDAALQKMRTITTTQSTTSSNDSSDQQPAVFIMNNMKTEPQQQQRTITVNRLLFSNNNNNNTNTTTTTTPTSTTYINGQNTINLATLVNSLNTLNHMAFLQSTNNSTTTQNSIAKLLETPILSTTNVVQQPQATLVPAVNHHSKFFILI